MAWEHVTHTCGHDERVQLYGPHRERDRRAAYLASQPCPACKRSKASAESKIIQEDWGLPDLRGTDKQVEWASKIRADWTERVTRSLQAEAGKAEDDDSRDMVGDYAAIVRGWATAIDDAAWWIDNRQAIKSPFAPVTAAIKQARRDGTWHRRVPVVWVDGQAYEPHETLPDGRSVMSVIAAATIADEDDAPSPTPPPKPESQPLVERAFVRAMGDDPGPDWIEDEDGDRVRVIHRRSRDLSVIVLNSSRGDAYHSILKSDLNDLGATYKRKLLNRYAVRLHDGSYVFFGERKWCQKEWIYTGQLADGTPARLEVRADAD